MNIAITKNFTVPHPVEVVWENITNPEKIVPCVPGASLAEMVDADNFKGEVELKFGPVKSKFGGDISFLVRDSASKTMKMKGVGTDIKGKGGAEMILDGVLTENNGNTDVKVTMDVSVMGILAQFGNRLASDATNHIFDQFIKNFKDQLDGKEINSSLSAGSMVGSMVKGLFGGK
jgi:carbon monoxide dehydrogenase subunit G